MLFMGKVTKFLWPFSIASYVCLPEGISPRNGWLQQTNDRAKGVDEPTLKLFFFTRDEETKHGECHGDHFLVKLVLPSGKRLHSYGKSPSLIGKSTIYGQFSIAMFVYQRVNGPVWTSSFLSLKKLMLAEAEQRTGTNARCLLGHHASSLAESWRSTLPWNVAKKAVNAANHCWLVETTSGC